MSKEEQVWNRKGRGPMLGGKECKREGRSTDSIMSAARGGEKVLIQEKSQALIRKRLWTKKGKKKRLGEEGE